MAPKNEKTSSASEPTKSGGDKQKKKESQGSFSIGESAERLGKIQEAGDKLCKFREGLLIAWSKIRHRSHFSSNCRR
uniref:Uncharacterized protein n=1 Tax=Tanacetum cinerariifolium TaxID=118510 RepID=A0A699HSP7_TANCI|nr:hypothetical protein [Tanacetum cinerariifolium]